MKQQNVVNMQIYKEKGEGTVLSMIWNVWHISVNWLVTSSTNIRMTFDSTVLLEWELLESEW